MQSSVSRTFHDKCTELYISKKVFVVQEKTEVKIKLEELVKFHSKEKKNSLKFTF